MGQKSILIRREMTRHR